MENSQEHELSRQEKREQRKEEQRAQAKSQRQGESARRWILWGSVVVLVLLVVGLTTWVAKQSDDGTGEGGGLISLDRPADDEWTKGPKDASLVLIEYSDFQCPACRAYYAPLKELVSSYDKPLLMVYRHFPLRQIHQFSQLAAQAGEAAGAQGKFWEMHDMLFERQNEWSQGTGQRATFTRYAEELGLDVEQFKSDLQSDTVKERVNRSYESGIRAGVNATPTFFLNGKRLEVTPNVSTFRGILDAEFERVSPASSTSVSAESAGDAEEGDTGATSYGNAVTQ